MKAEPEAGEAAVNQANWAARRATADGCWANANQASPLAWEAWRPATAAGVEHGHEAPLSCWPVETGRSLTANTSMPCPEAAYAVAHCRKKERGKERGENIKSKFY